MGAIKKDKVFLNFRDLILKVVVFNGDSSSYKSVRGIGRLGQVVMILEAQNYRSKTGCSLSLRDSASGCADAIICLLQVGLKGAPKEIVS